MTYSTGEVRRFLADRVVAALLGLQVLVTVGVVAAQYLGFDQLAYYLGIVPEGAIILYAVLGEVTGITFLGLAGLFPLGIVLFVAAYYFVAVAVALPGRAVYRYSRGLPTR